MAQPLFSLTKEQQEIYMHMAIEQARQAALLGEVPIGALVVYQGKVIGTGFNLREKTQDATTHAEIAAIQAACRYLNSWRLEDCQLIVTLEPCPMCAGAIVQARIPELYFGARDPKAGAVGSLVNLVEDSRFNHQVAVKEAILTEECGQLLTDFFRNIRERKKHEKNLKRTSNFD